MKRLTRLSSYRQPVAEARKDSTIFLATANAYPEGESNELNTLSSSVRNSAQTSSLLPEKNASLDLVPCNSPFSTFSATPEVQELGIFTKKAGDQDGDPDYLDVYVIGRPFTEWGGPILGRMPEDARLYMLDVGICHYMAVFRSPDGRLLQVDFGPKGGDVQKANPLRRLKPPMGHLNMPCINIGQINGLKRKGTQVKHAAASVKEEPSSGADGAGNTFDAAITPLTFDASPHLGGDMQHQIQTHYFEPSPDNQSICDTQKRGSDSPLKGEAAVQLPSNEGVRQENGASVQRRVGGVPGEIRQRLLSELPVAHLYVGRTYRSLEEVWAYNASHAATYVLHRNDCRHYVNGLVHYLTGLPASTTRFKRAHFAHRSQGRWAWHHPLTLLAQVLTDVGSWDKVCATGKASAAAMLALHAFPQAMQAAGTVAASGAGGGHLHLPTLALRRTGGMMALQRSVAGTALGAATAATFREGPLAECVARARRGVPGGLHINVGRLARGLSEAAHGALTRSGHTLGTLRPLTPQELLPRHLPPFNSPLLSTLPSPSNLRLRLKPAFSTLAASTAKVGCSARNRAGFGGGAAAAGNRGGVGAHRYEAQQGQTQEAQVASLDAPKPACQRGWGWRIRPQSKTSITVRKKTTAATFSTGGGDVNNNGGSGMHAAKTGSMRLPFQVQLPRLPAWPLGLKHVNLMRMGELAQSKLAVRS